MARIVLIYDAPLRLDTTGTLCRAALARLGHEVVHYPPLRRDGDTLRSGGQRG